MQLALGVLLGIHGSGRCATHLRAGPHDVHLLPSQRQHPHGAATRDALCRACCRLICLVTMGSMPGLSGNEISNLLNP